jgi:hypothetical protein
VSCRFEKGADVSLAGLKRLCGDGRETRNIILPKRQGIASKSPRERNASSQDKKRESQQQLPFHLFNYPHSIVQLGWLQTFLLKKTANLA